MKYLKIVIIGLLSSIIFNGCSEEVPVFVAGNNLDEFKKWGMDNPRILEGDAHSGRFYTMIDSSNIYSLGYTAKLGEMGIKPGAKVKFSAFAKFPNAIDKAVLVLDLQTPEKDKSIQWTGISLMENIKEVGQWREVKGEIVIPNEAKADTPLLFFVWNNGKETILLDDFKIEAYQ